MSTAQIVALLSGVIVSVAIRASNMLTEKLASFLKVKAPPPMTDPSNPQPLPPPSQESESK